MNKNAFLKITLDILNQKRIIFAQVLTCINNKKERYSIMIKTIAIIAAVAGLITTADANSLPPTPEAPFALVQC